MNVPCQFSSNPSHPHKGHVNTHPAIQNSTVTIKSISRNENLGGRHRE